MAPLSDRTTRTSELPAGDEALVYGLRAHDEDLFRQVVDAWSPAMLRLARIFVAGAASAEDVVQDAWLAVLSGLDGFQGRSSLRSWVFTIVVNRARTRGAREARTVPISQLGSDDDSGPTVDPARFQGPSGTYPRNWTSTGAPQRWDQTPEQRALAAEAIGVVEAAVDRLPPRQRLTVSLRDIHGLTAEETCAVLGVSPENQRVLLHRARAALRRVLEDYYRC